MLTSITTAGWLTLANTIYNSTGTLKFSYKLSLFRAIQRNSHLHLHPSPRRPLPQANCYAHSLDQRLHYLDAYQRSNLKEAINTFIS